LEDTLLKACSPHEHKIRSKQKTRYTLKLPQNQCISELRPSEHASFNALIDLAHVLLLTLFGLLLRSLHVIA